MALASTAAAQKKSAGIVAGNVLDSVTQRPVAGATIRLAMYSDSLKAILAQATDKGYFELQSLPYGYYSLRVSAVGFSKLVIDSLHIRPERFDFNLGDLKLWTTANELQQVVVFVEKPMLESGDGKITFNAGESALSAGSTTADMLRTLPLISNDANGRLLLRGKEPRIMIDEKPVELNAQQLQELLESMPGGAIEKIELIQNPSPELGTEPGGVINIVTKKGKVGFTGRASVSAGTRGEGVMAINAGYRSSKWNLQGNGSLTASRLTGYNTSTRNNYYTDSSNSFVTDGDFTNESLRPNLRVQADYTPNKLHSFSAVLQANSNHFSNQSITRFENHNRFDDLWRLSRRTVDATGNQYNLSPQFTWQWKSKRAGENLRLLTSLSAGRQTQDRNFAQQFLDPKTELPNGTDSLQLQATDNSYLNSQHRLNYNRPLVAKKLTLNTGAGWLTTHNDNELVSSYFDKGQQQWLVSAPLSNAFSFDQHIGLLRAGFTWMMPKGWRFIPYLQYEFTTFEIDNKGQGSASQNYHNWLPGFTLRKDLSKVRNISLVYRTSVRRPQAHELNPAIDYSDPYNLRYGNPALVPSYGHHADLNYGYTKGNSYFNASLGYNYISDIIAQVRTLQNEGKTHVTWQNIAARQEYEAAAWTGYSFSKLFRLNGSLGYTWMTYDETLKQQFGYRNGATYYATINVNLVFSNVFSMDGSTRFSNTADPQGRSRSNVNSSFGAQYKLFNRRLIISANVIDPFTRQEYTTTTTGTNFDLVQLRSSRTRNYRLTLAWQLNRVVKLPSALAKPPVQKRTIRE